MTQKATKDKIDRVALGKLLADTQKEHQKQQIEVGEFVEEVGNKEVMKEVWRQIDERKGLPQWRDKYYILVWFKKNAILNRAIEVFVQCRHTDPKKEWGLTCFSFEPKTDNLLLEWVLPNRSAVPMFMKTRDYTDPFLIKCIEDHLSELRNL